VLLRRTLEALETSEVIAMLNTCRTSARPPLLWLRVLIIRRFYLCLAWYDG
jgi:hypothetical protein